MAGFLNQRHQGAERVEDVDQEEGENHHDHLEIEESRFGIDKGREVELAEHGRHAVGKRDGTP